MFNNTHGSPALLQLVHDFLGRYESWQHRALSFETSISQQPNITRARIDVATRDGRRARLVLPLTNSDSSMHANVKEVGELYQVVLGGRDNPPAQLRHLADYASPVPKWTYLLRRDETTAVKRRILQEFLSVDGVHRVSYRCTREPEAPGYLVVDAFAPAGDASLLIHLAPEHHEQLQELEAMVQARQGVLLPNGRIYTLSHGVAGMAERAAVQRVEVGQVSKGVFAEPVDVLVAAGG